MKKIMTQKMNLVIFTLAYLTIGTSLCAQVKYIPAAVHDFSLSVGGGITDMYANTTKKIFDGAARGNFDFNFTPFISLSIEGQIGKMGDGKQNDLSSGGPVYSVSTFYAANLNARVSLGQWLDITNDFTEVLGGLYLGAGIGYLNTDIQTIQYVPLLTESNYIVYKHALMTVPVNIGINKDLPVYKLGVNLNFQYNFTGSNSLDGFDYHVTGHRSQDGYSFLSLAIRYYFGPVE